MHRSLSLLRLIACWSLLGLLWHAGISSAQAQAPADTPVIIMTVGGTKFYPEIPKDDFKKVVNSNPKALNVQSVAGKFNQVLFEAVGPGRSQVTLIDVKDNVTIANVLVIKDKVAELKSLIQGSLPTASVTVTSTDSGNAVILTGFVMSADDARVVHQISAQLFGTNIVNNVRIGGVQQVQVEVIVAVVDRSEARNMTFSWVENGNNAFLSSFFGAPLSFASTLTQAGATGFSSSLASTGAANIPFGVLNSKNSFMGFLQALRTEGLAKIYAEPHVMTLSGQTGQVISGGETPIITSSTGGSSITYKQFGTVVTFLPIVLGNGKIYLDINAEVSQLNAANGVNVATAGSIAVAPGFSTRRATAKMQMEDGQTLALGGLIQNTVNGTISRVPVLGDIPFLGVAFSSKTYTETEEELLILVTPRLIDPVDCCKIPKYLPGRETRSADDFEFFLEGIQEAPRGQRDWTCLHYRGAHMAPNGNPAYPCNDASGCYRGFRAGSNGNNCANGSCGLPATYSVAPAGVSQPNYAVGATAVPVIDHPTMPAVTTMPQVGPAVPTSQIIPTSAPMPAFIGPVSSR